MLFELSRFGIYNYTLLLILMLPIISTLISISRHLIGMQTLSLYAPIVLSYAFIVMSIDSTAQKVDSFNGLFYGAVFYIVVVTIAALLYRLLRQFRINYYSKMSLIFSGIAGSVLIVYTLGSAMGNDALLNINIFSIVMIAAIAERIVASYARTDFYSVSYLAGETLAIAIVSLAIFSIPFIQELLLNNPWILALIVLVNLLVGNYKGLRLTEFIRFRSILDKDYDNK
jgi:hypothetical protein